MILDTSALLALFFNESQGPWVEDQMGAHRASLRMSTVNLAETLILIRDRQPQLFEEMREELLSSSIHFIPPTVRQAEIAAKARLEYSLNLGDCFAYALAIDENCPILTLDPDFKKSDAKVVIP